MKYYYPLLIMGWMVASMNAQVRNVTTDSLTVTPADTVQALYADTAISSQKHHWDDVAYIRLQMGYNQETWNTHDGVSRPSNLGGFNVGIALGLENKDNPIVLEVAPSLSFDFHREKDSQGRLSQKMYYSALTLPVNLVFRLPLQPEKRKQWCLLPFVGIHGTCGLNGWDKYYDSAGKQILQNDWFAPLDEDVFDSLFDEDSEISQKRACPAMRATRSNEDENISNLDGVRLQLGVQWGVGVHIGVCYIGYQWDENLTHIWNHTKMRTHYINVGYHFEAEWL